MTASAGEVEEVRSRGRRMRLFWRPSQGRQAPGPIPRIPWCPRRWSFPPRLGPDTAFLRARSWLLNSGPASATHLGFMSVPGSGVRPEIAVYVIGRGVVVCKGRSIASSAGCWTLVGETVPSRPIPRHPCDLGCHCREIRPSRTKASHLQVHWSCRHDKRGRIHTEQPLAQLGRSCLLRLGLPWT